MVQSVCQVVIYINHLLSRQLFAAHGNINMFITYALVVFNCLPFSVSWPYGQCCGRITNDSVLMSITIYFMMYQSVLLSMFSNICSCVAMSLLHPEEFFICLWYLTITQLITCRVASPQFMSSYFISYFIQKNTVYNCQELDISVGCCAGVDHVVTV